MIQIRNAAMAVMGSLFVAAPASAWTAISIDEPSMVTAVCRSPDSEFNAGTCTLAHCKDDCRIVASFHESCASVVASDREIHVGFGEDATAAAEQATSTCEASGTSSCRVLESACD